MKHILLVAAFTFASVPVATGQVPGSPAPQDGGSVKVPIFPSPVMGFREQPGAPLRLLFDATLAVPGSTRTVEVRLVPRAEGGGRVRAYTFYCEEALADAPDDGAVVRQLRRFKAQGLRPTVFRVQKDSQLTFWLGSVEYEGGAVWQAELP